MTPIAEKVLKLILLATNPGASEHEARTAALLACQAIRQHGLVVSDPRVKSSLPPPPRPAPPPPEKRVIITSKFSGYCTKCLEFYAVGERIYWVRGGGAYHFACPPPRKARPSATHAYTESEVISPDEWDSVFSKT